jgi:hypothetical protein
MKYDPQTYKLTDSGIVGKIALVISLVGIIASIAGYFIDHEQFYHSYLVAFVYWLSIGLGALFFTMLHHLVAATWSVVLRRLVENIMSALPYLAIFAIILIPGIHNLYHWSHPDTVGTDHILQGKAPYLNQVFFIIRLVIYFGVWFFLSQKLYSISIEQDSGFKESQVARMRKISAPGMILFAITLTFAAFDWLMSLDAHWYSTIYGVYVFAGAVLSMLAFLTLIVMYFYNNNILIKEITVEHYHDLGKLLFAFIVFWGYMAFSQYFLIWYGNMPEETVWFLNRWQGAWKNITLLIVFGHFVIPFFILFPRGPKRNRIALTIMAIWILIMHWVDLYWLVMPSLHPDNPHISWIDITTCMAIGGMFIWLICRKMTSGPLLPINDPRLTKSMKFTS